jgi:hypothetical protein
MHERDWMHHVFHASQSVATKSSIYVAINAVFNWANLARLGGDALHLVIWCWLSDIRGFEPIANRVDLTDQSLVLEALKSALTDIRVSCSIGQNGLLEAIRCSRERF